jgi:hypothetical protein
MTRWGTVTTERKEVIRVAVLASNNENGESIEISIDADDDDGRFILIDIEDGSSKVIGSYVIDTERDADEFLQLAQDAHAKFTKLKTK